MMKVIFLVISFLAQESDQSTVRKRYFPKLRSFAEKRANFENPIESLFSSKRSHQLAYDDVSGIMGGPKDDPDIVYKRYARGSPGFEYKRAMNFVNPLEELFQKREFRNPIEEAFGKRANEFRNPLEDLFNKRSDFTNPLEEIFSSSQVAPPLDDLYLDDSDLTNPLLELFE